MSISPIPPSRQPISRFRADAFAIGALVLLVVVFFWRLTFTNLILPRGDVFTYFYPYWDYRNAVLRTGHIPLWNPYLFMGAPFLANSQAGVLYPLNWPLIPFSAPTAIKIAIVAHSILASVGMYLFARRSLGLTILSSTLAGVVFGLGGYLTAQIEHVNQLQGLAWLPWLFWLWEEAAAGKRRAVLWLSLGMAMQLLAGHTQSAFITAMGLSVWAVWHTVGIWRARIRRYARWASLKNAAPHLVSPVGMMLAALILASGLAAAQLLPTLELTGLSNRSGGLPFLEALSFSLHPALLGRALLPGYSATPLFTEYVAYPGIAALLLALLGAWLRRGDWKIPGLIVLAFLAIFLALGGYNPLYWLLVRLVPGFNLFRAPARWLVLWAFAVAGLAGAGLDELPASRVAWHRVVVAGSLFLMLAAWSFAAVFVDDPLLGATAPMLPEVLLWLVALTAALALIAWLRSRSQRARETAPILLASLAAVELFAASRGLALNRLSTPAALTSQRPAISTLLAAGQHETPPGRLLSLSDILFDPGDLREIEAIYTPYLAEDAVYDYVIAAKHQEIVAPNLPLYWRIPSMDGFDGGILPTRDFTRFTSLFLDQQDVTPDGRLRENLHYVPDAFWLNVANVRYVITDKVYDKWIDGVYYDLQFPMRIGSVAGREVDVEVLTPHTSYPFEATAVGMVGHLEGAASLPDGALIGNITVYGPELTGSQPVTLPLLVGRDLAEGDPASAQHSTLDVVGHFSPDRPTIAEYHTVIDWSEYGALSITRLEVSASPSVSGILVIRGMTLIDQRTGAFAPMTLPHEVNLIHSGDVKIYELPEVMPRAYLVCQPHLAQAEEAMWASIETSTLTVMNSGAAPPSSACQTGGTVRFTLYEPEQVAIEVDASGDGSYLILSDAWYPGWLATIDGESVPTLRANGMFRAVGVPSGRHTVVWRYEPRSFLVGVIISGVCLLGTVLGLIFSRPRPARAATRPVP